MRRFGISNLPAVLLATILFSTGGCNNSQGEDIFGAPNLWLFGPQRLSVYFNEPGISQETGVDRKVDQRLVEMIDEAENTVDLAVYNLGRSSIIDAMIRAEERGLDVRMVGDVDEVVTSGYRSILRTQIPFSLGNSTAIQHNKFAVVDGRYTFMGTGNITDNGFIRNNNNFMIIEDLDLADHYTREFRQMFFGRYGSKKLPFTTRRNFLVNFTPIEVYYSPYGGQDAMDRIIEMIRGARTEIKFFIFAFTHDEMATELIRAARRGVLVQGIHDKTFVRGTSEEAPRLYNGGRYLGAFGPDIREDGNEHTKVKGISASGGKLHTKSICVDRVVCATGSFNWSNNAVENNDENMVVVNNPFIAQELLEQWQRIWDVGRPITGQIREAAGDAANPGDVVISEIAWAGSYTGTSLDAGDDWLELYNRTNAPIDVSHWSISWDQRETKFFPIPDQYNWFKPGIAGRHIIPGRLIIPAGGYFLLKAKNNKGINNSDVKISGTKSFTLESSSLRVRLYDAAMNLIDEAGDGTPPSAGKLDSFRRVAYSMERFFYPTGHPLAGRALPGASPGSWYTSNGNNLTGGALVGGGQLQSAYGICTDSGGNATNCTVGTPNYSGSTFSVANPSNASGGENAYTNLPLAAFSTGMSSAAVRMRWAMQNAPAITGGACPCTSMIDANDPALLRVSTAAQTPGTTYTINVGAATDITTGASTAGNISFEGHGQANAQFWIERVYPRESSSEDVVVLRALSSGTMHNLGVYYYDAFSPSPQLIYRFADVPVTAGQYAIVKMDTACDAPCGVTAIISEDARLGSSPSFNIAANPASAPATGLPAATSWEVFAPVPGLSSTDGIIFISYDLNAPPLDLMCYSNRDGDASNGLMRGGFRDVFAFGSGVYNLSATLPVDEVNDTEIQSGCSNYTGTGSGSYLNRIVDTNRGSDFVCVNC